MVMEDGEIVFYTINLSTGALFYSSFYKTSLPDSSVNIGDITLAMTDNKINIIGRGDSLTYYLQYDFSTNTFMNAKSVSGYHTYFACSTTTHTYFGGAETVGSTAHITRILGDKYNSNYDQDHDFVLSDTSESLVSDGLFEYSLGSDTSITVVSIINPSTATSSLAFVDPGTYTESVNGNYQSDLVYQNEEPETFYIQENYSGTLSFDFACSISGLNSITSVVSVHPTSTPYASWVSMNGDGLNLDVVAPSFIGTGDTYYFSIDSTVFGETVQKTASITVFRCLVLN